ncbi:hypothetical protein [Zooshikella harenae]|uniref:Lipoprotein n=1 Tax=Zooshikella harenae TaxID=2827238 RepID=A0ABS5ZJJ5_9GAMM|nr:hypothetical protein [Zooshikella harenae]MBU2714115.1 hypothetical protein [Zooshikella harenae]
MKKALLLIVLSVFFSGCATPIKRFVAHENVIVSENHPKVRLVVPNGYELFDKCSGKNEIKFDDASGISYEHQDWFQFRKRNNKGLIDNVLHFRFSDAPKGMSYNAGRPDNSYFNRSAVTINGISYTTYLIARKQSSDKAKVTIDACIMGKLFDSFLTDEKSHQFSISYTSFIPCEKLVDGRVVDDGLVHKFDLQANELIRKMSQ